MPVPTEAEWGEYQADLDQKYAHSLFAGHTNEEMQPHFYRNVIERTDELRWMPEVPFRYYMLGFRDFVMAGKFVQNTCTVLIFFIVGLLFLSLEHVFHRELIASRWRPAFSSHLVSRALSESEVR